MDFGSISVDTILVVLVAALVQLLKPLIKSRMPADDPQHQAVIRLMAAVLGVIAVALAHGVPKTGPDLLITLWFGLGTGATAVGGYHLITSGQTILPSGSEGSQQSGKGPLPPPNQ